MKPPHLPLVNLHWQLLPHNPHRRKPAVHFDITVPITNIKFVAAYRTPLSNFDLDKLVADEPLEEMMIECEGLPKGYVRISRPASRPITCRDVYEEIFQAYNRVLSDAERRREFRAMHPERLQGISDAFKSRCASSQGLRGYEEGQGYRWVDLLQGRTMFLGLTQPKPTANWILQLGYPQQFSR